RCVGPVPGDEAVACLSGSAQSISPPVHMLSSAGREPGSNLPVPSVAMGRLDFKWQRDLRPLSARPTVGRLAPDYRRTAPKCCSSPGGPGQTVTMDILGTTD